MDLLRLNNTISSERLAVQNLLHIVSYVSGALAIFANILVIAVVAAEHHVSKYALIIQLAIADVLMAFPQLISFIFMMASSSSIHIPLSKAVLLCKIALTWWGFAYILSVFTLTLISIERYRMLLLSAPSYSVGRRLTIAICAIWAIDILLIIPLIPMINIDPVYGYKCNLRFQYGRLSASIYFTILATMCYILPGFTIVFCYSKCIAILNKIMHLTILQSHSLTVRQAEIQKVTKMLITITIYFIIMSTPWIINLIVNVYPGYDLVQPLYTSPSIIATVMSILSTSLFSTAPLGNAIIYATMSPLFRRVFLRWCSRNNLRVGTERRVVKVGNFN
ncbi:Somatostatin receptor type 4 [Trichoplax sp. H2]|nr:Somatostatin receptor type 4 [Trichoplax sp. H2]|eukprot:RDD39879.1 Somatostatin receptor type 4 [Trichoplax sp. H2]